MVESVQQPGHHIEPHALGDRDVLDQVMSQLLMGGVVMVLRGVFDSAPCPPTMYWALPFTA